jgi:hypothetical protein
MTNFLKTAVATAGLLSGAMLPLGASAMQSSQQYTFDTAIRNDQQAGEIDGRLTLRVSPDGIVQGEYRNYDVGGLKPVAGGLNGDRIWFTIGLENQVRVVGTLRDGVLHGIVQKPGIATITFDSVPATTTSH